MLVMRCHLKNGHVGFKPTITTHEIAIFTPLKKWCAWIESNYRHGNFQSPALPTELQAHGGDGGS